MARWIDRLTETVAKSEAEGLAVGGSAGWWQSRWLWLALAAVSVLPFLLSPLPPLGDLFSHIGRYHIMLDGRRSPYLSRYFHFQWDLIPNLGQDLLVLAVAPLMGAERAGIFLSALIPPLMILLMRELSKAAHGAVQPTALLALPFVYSFTYLYGFMNYHTGVVVVLAAMLVWLRARDWRPVPRIALLALISLVAWVAHMSAWAILLVAIGSFELVVAVNRHGWSPKRVVAQVLPTMLPMVLPGLITLARYSPDAVTAAKPSLFLWLYYLKFYWLTFPLRDESKLLDLASLLFIAAVPALLFAVRRLRLDAGLALAAAIVFALFWVVPTDLMGGFYADMRLLPVFWIFFLLACRGRWANRRQAQIVALAALALFGVRMAVTTHAWIVRGASLQAELGALDHVPVGARIAHLSPERKCKSWHNTGIHHLASLGIVRRDAFVSSEWDIPGQQLMQPTYLRGSVYNINALMNPPGQDCGGYTAEAWLAGLPRDRFDFVWLFSAPAPGDTRDWLEPVYRGPTGTLYRIVHH
jgi:hypothetical protein